MHYSSGKIADVSQIPLEISEHMFIFSCKVFLMDFYKEAYSLCVCLQFSRQRLDFFECNFLD